VPLRPVPDVSAPLQRLPSLVNRHLPRDPPVPVVILGPRRTSPQASNHPASRFLLLLACEKRSLAVRRLSVGNRVALFLLAEDPAPELTRTPPSSTSSLPHGRPLGGARVRCFPLARPHQPSPASTPCIVVLCIHPSPSSAPSRAQQAPSSSSASARRLHHRERSKDAATQLIQHPNLDQLVCSFPCIRSNQCSSPLGSN
jgi:hypothetical protein